MKSKKVLGRCLLVLLCIVAAIAIAGVAQFYHRSDPKNRKQYDTNNPFITAQLRSRRTAAALAISRRKRWQPSGAAWRIRCGRSTTLNLIYI